MSNSKETNPNYPSKTGNPSGGNRETLLNQHHHPKVETPERSSYKIESLKYFQAFLFDE